MDFEISRTVGVVLERRPARSRWADHVWRVVDVLDGAADAELFAPLPSPEAEVERFFAGNTALTLHRADTEAYRINLAGDRVLYVVMRADETGAHPYALHTVTASPHEACDLLDSGEELVETVPMSPSILAWVELFCARHHRERPFVKRRRDRVDVDQLLFSKQPIFVRAPEMAPVDPDEPDD